MHSIFDAVIDRRGSDSLKWNRYGKDVLPLWVADTDFQSPEPVRRALHRAVDHGIFGYEFMTPRTAQVVADRMERLYGWKVSPSWVVAVPGIVAGLNVAVRTACSAAPGVLVQPPIYGPFLHVPELSGTVLQTAPLEPVRDNHSVRYELDTAAFGAGLNSNDCRTGILLLCNPHNPVGQIYRRQDLEHIAEACLKNGTLICSDEVHSELLLGGSSFVPIASLSPEIEKNSITLVSPSKTFNVVGTFCGFAIIPNAGVRSRFRKVMEGLAMHVNSLGLIAAEAAFAGQCDSWLKDLRSYLTQNRDFVLQYLPSEMPGIRSTVPEATFLAWLDCTALVQSRTIGDNPYKFFLEKAKVGLNPGPDFGKGNENFVRLNFGCPRSTLAEALDRMKQAVLQAEPLAS